MAINNEPRRRLRIRSTGHGLGTTVELVADDGSDPIPLHGVVAATWSVRVDGLATAKLEFLVGKVDVIGEEQRPADHAPYRMLLPFGDDTETRPR
jgi:hypothetical protein